MKTCKDCIHYDVCAYHITEETDMSVEECANGFKDRDNLVEVVRCKDCMWRQPLTPVYNYNSKPAMICFCHHRPTREDGYCYEGIRKGANNE